MYILLAFWVLWVSLLLAGIRNRFWKSQYQDLGDKPQFWVTLISGVIILFISLIYPVREEVVSNPVRRELVKFGNSVFVKEGEVFTLLGSDIDMMASAQGVETTVTEFSLFGARYDKPKSSFEWNLVKLPSFPFKAYTK